MKNILLTIAYDGSHFCGWQKQPGCRTVQGRLEEVLSDVCLREIQLAGTSRTDAGVHALGQRATFSGEFGIPPERIPRAVNNLLQQEGDLRILEARQVPPDFHARFNAKGKTYLYRIRNDEEPDLFQRNFCYQVLRPLNLEAMKEAAQHFVGQKDFRSCMAAGGKEMESTVRTLFRVQVTETREGSRGHRFINIEVTGDGFLYNMVRIIVGTLVDIGLSKLYPDHIPVILEGCSRSRAGHTAPPQGLYLKEIYFTEEELLKKETP